MAMVAAFTTDRRGQRRRKWQAYILVLLDWSPQKVHKRYRHRFGIESSYRQLRRVRAFTTSLNPALRFLLLGLGLLLVNIWLYLRWHVARVRAPGPRRVDPLHFPLQRFIRFLAHAIDAAYGAIRSILTPLPPQSVIY
jgi:IS4 transposase